MKHYISHFSSDRQGKVMKLQDATFDSSQFEVKFDENKQLALDSEVANVIDNVVASHVNNKLEFIGQNMHNMFDDHFSRIKAHPGMKSISNDKQVFTSNTDKTMGGSANGKNSTTIAMATNSANQHNQINYSSTPNANAPYEAASSLQHIPTSPNFAQPYGTPTVNQPRTILDPAMLKMK